VLRGDEAQRARREHDKKEQVDSRHF
jgi:hypothetical protein